jgi:glycosyltransferase involved in cell wall biosynthesis
MRKLGVELMKTVGTVVATYNGERYLDEQLKSIINQSQRPQQIVIVDDCSQDETKEIIRKYVKELPDLFLFIENKENLGAKRTFEIGISKCETDYIALCDQDDVWKPDKIEKQFNSLEDNRDSKLCFHDLELIDKKGDTLANSYWKVAPSDEPLPVIGRQARARVAGFSNPVPGCTMFFSSSLKDYIIPISSSIWIGHDWWISVIAFFFDAPIYVNETLSRYRFHPYQAAGIGTSLKKKKDQRSILSVRSRIVREVKRIMHKKKSKRMKLIALNESRYAMSIELIKIIEKCEKINVYQNRKHEYKLLRNRLKKNLVTFIS